MFKFESVCEAYSHVSNRNRTRARCTPELHQSGFVVAHLGCVLRENDFYTVAVLLKGNLVIGFHL